MFNRKSDYALNKKNMASIVYKDAYDNIIQLSVATQCPIKRSEIIY